jgi:DNA-binding XRE family transcriptional regulator
LTPGYGPRSIRLASNIEYPAPTSPDATLDVRATTQGEAAFRVRSLLHATKGDAVKFDFAEVIRLREARGMAQHELAAAVGVNRATISRLEKGNRDPRAATCGRIARVLGVPVEQILHD